MLYRINDYKVNNLTKYRVIRMGFSNLLEMEFN